MTFASSSSSSERAIASSSSDPKAFENPVYFGFEADFVASLRCIPMQVRFKLDACGVKLKLHQWATFSQNERLTLARLRCTSDRECTVYREFLCGLVAERTGEAASLLPLDPAPPWADTAIVPPEVRDRARDRGIDIAQVQWCGLSDLQRFALVKLVRSHHEHRNFDAALREFGLM